MVCRDFIPHGFCKPCLFLSISYLRKLSYLIHQREYPSSGQNRNLSVVKLWSNEKSPPNWRWFSLKMVDLIGIEPTTLRMRTVRSPSWAIGPNWPFLNQKSYEKRIFEIFSFEGEVRKIGLLNWKGTRAVGCDCIWMRTQRSPSWATSPSTWFSHQNHTCNSDDKRYYTIIFAIVKHVFHNYKKIWEEANFRLPIPAGYSKM